MQRFVGISIIAFICFAPAFEDHAATLSAQPRKIAAKFKEPPATPADSLKVLKDFKVELLYSVPKDKEGSWVSMCVDPKGRLIVSDQYGGLYRIVPPAVGGKAEDTKIEPIPLKVGNKVFGDAHGLLWAFDSLYAVVNSSRIPSGLYRIRDTNGDDILDETSLLAKLEGGQREHGPHAVLLSPDAKSLTIVVGNQEPVVKVDTSRVPRHWGEDHLLPRLPDGRGFMAGVLGPGGCIYKVDPDGKNWELISTGYRNPYDAAYNQQGDLFTYDADMEWDFNTPWYRPTRICLAVSGSDFGWRNGSGKWPAYYADTWPAIYDVGPGSPTGVCFGYGARFPLKYQNALFACDWSYGKLYAVHLTPYKEYYTAEAEEFVSGSPLPLTDIVVNPKDGALYFTIGGRKTKSGLYRVTYTGKEPVESFDETKRVFTRPVSAKLESFHGKADPKAVETAWPYLNSDDRFVRNAARVALEHQDPKTWMEKALSEKDAVSAIQALLALVRVTSDDPQHKKTPVDEKLKGQILSALDAIDWASLGDSQKLDLLRVYGVLFVRMGPPDESARKRIVDRLDPAFPAKNRFLNAELCQFLVYLQVPGTAGKSLKLISEAPTQEEQMDYAKSLRMLKAGWTTEQREQYFKWFLKAANFKGGNSFEGFMSNVKNDAIATLSAKEKLALKSILEAKPEPKTVFVGPPRPLYKQYKMEDLAGLLERGLTNRDFDSGRKLFGIANCFACHRFDNEGGAHGPDLTAAAGKFSARDLLESIVEPSKVISDQYAAVNIETDDGKRFSGRIVNLHDNTIHLMPNMMEPNNTVGIDRRKIESMTPSKVSPMPTGLIDTLKEEEVLDLMAYLLSRGDRQNKMFKK